MLPASYQSDINELVQEFAKNMDASFGLPVSAF